MTDASFDVDDWRMPKGYRVEILPGWRSVDDTEGDEFVVVKRGALEVPHAFELRVQSIDNGIDDWGVILLFWVSATTQEVELTGGWAGGFELDEVLEKLRKIRPLSWWKQACLNHFALAAANPGEVPQDGSESSQAPGDPLRDRLRLVKPIPAARRRNRITIERLQEVAEVYRRAWADSLNPTVAVSKHFRVTPKTAARWVGRARQAGELGLANGTRGGEVEVAPDGATSAPTKPTRSRR